MLVPAHDANASIMAKHAADFGTLGDVPDLDLAGTKAYADVGAIARPLDAADVSIRAGLEKAADTALGGRPDVDVALEADGDLIPGAPVEKVEIVVVNEARGIQDSVRTCSNATAELSGAGVGWPDGSVVLLAEVDRPGGLGRSGLELEDACVHANTTSVGEGVLVCHGIG